MRYNIPAALDHLRLVGATVHDKTVFMPTGRICPYTQNLSDFLRLEGYRIVTPRAAAQHFGARASEVML